MWHVHKIEKVVENHGVHILWDFHKGTDCHLEYNIRYNKN